MASAVAAGVRPSPAVVDALAQLVAFPTVSSDSNLALIDWVEQQLVPLGASVRRVPSPCGSKSNLLARLGPAVAGGVVLSGHTDVVPVSGQPWTTDPFALTERDGRLYGRGTCDMKGFLALALALAPEMTTLARPVYLALSYDEEVGCLGAPLLIDLLREEPSPAAVIVGEPTEMGVVTAHKGVAYLRTSVTGHEAHSSLQHQGASAIMAAARLMHWLGEQQAQNARAAAESSNAVPTPQTFQPSQAATKASAAAAFPLPDPPYTTLHCGLVAGGTAPNITAGHCEFTTDIRTIAGDDPKAYVAAYRTFAEQQVLPTLRAVHPDTAIAIDLLANAPPFQAPRDCPAVELAHRLTGQNASTAQPYAAEAGQFQSAGFATIMCGPGSIEQAHQPDEYIELEQLARGEAMLRRLLAELAVSP